MFACCHGGNIYTGTVPMKNIVANNVTLNTAGMKSFR
jgi:hypothetical protein